MEDLLSGDCEMRHSLILGKTEKYQNEYGQYWCEAHGKVLVDDEPLAIYSLVVDGVGCLHQIGVKTYLESCNSVCLIAGRIISFDNDRIGFSLLDLPIPKGSEDRFLSRDEIMELPENEQAFVWEIFEDVLANDPRIGSIRKQAMIQ